MRNETLDHEHVRVLTFGFRCGGFASGPICPNTSAAEPLTVHVTDGALRFLKKDDSKENQHFPRQKVRRAERMYRMRDRGMGFARGSLLIINADVKVLGNFNINFCGLLWTFV